jgi:hypothetical protein
MERETDQFGTVVTMGQNRVNARQITAELRAYWEGLRRGRLVPSRAEVDPRGIDRALEYSFILERVAPGMGRFRLAGMHLNDLMGMEVRGMPLTAFFAPAGRRRIAELTEAMFQDPAVVEITLQAETGIGKPPMKAVLLLLPLKSDLGDVNRAMGCLIAEGEIGRAPRRFDVVETSVTPIVAGAPTPRDTPAPLSTEALDFAEAFKPFARKPAVERRAEGAARDPRILTPEERRALFRVVKNDA